MDEWRPQEALDLGSVVPPSVRDSSESEEEGEGHEMLGNAAQVRAYNELTKVKNIEEIELGRYTMETWCMLCS